MNQTATNRALPLQGVTALEFCHYVSGPYAGKLLRDYGADVIQVVVKSEDVADDKVGTSQALLNRQKHRIVVDLADPSAKPTLSKLIANVDVVIQNRPGEAEQFGLGYSQVAATNPSVVYCQIGSPGFSDAEIAGARIELSRSLTETEKDWCLVGPSITDQLAGLYAVNGILSALVARDRTGEGSLLDTDIFSSSLAFLSTNIAEVTISDLVALPFDRAHGVIAFNFHCSDGEAIAVNVPAPEIHWKEFLDVIGLSEMHADPRYTSRRLRLDNFEILRSELQDRFGAQPKQYWIDLLEQSTTHIGTPTINWDIASDSTEDAVVKSYESASLGSEPVRFGPGGTTTASRQLDTSALLMQLGVSADELSGLGA